jgi:hypothetical protein
MTKRLEVLEEFAAAALLGREHFLGSGGLHLVRAPSDADYFRAYRARHRERINAQQRANRAKRLEELRGAGRDRTRAWRERVHAAIGALVAKHKLKSKWRLKL